MNNIDTNAAAVNHTDIKSHLSYIRKFATRAIESGAAPPELCACAWRLS